MADEHDLIEQLAAIEHRRWADWQQWMHDQCVRDDDGSLTIPAGLVSRWERQIDTPYADLSEREQESDREQVRRYWPLIAPIISERDALTVQVAALRAELSAGTVGALTAELTEAVQANERLTAAAALVNDAWLVRGVPSRLRLAGLTDLADALHDLTRALLAVKALDGPPARQEAATTPAPAAAPPRPTIVCLCGSTRFCRTFQEASLQETLAGRIVLSIGAASGTDDEHFGNLPRAEYNRVKEQLDQLHLRKVEMADEVLILNVGGYVGESTRRELFHAMDLGKRVRWWETAPADAGQEG